MKPLSQTLLEAWAIKKLREVGLTPDPDAAISVREKEEWTEGFCDTCGPDFEYYVVIVVNGHDTLTMSGNLYNLMNEIMASSLFSKETA